MRAAPFALRSGRDGRPDIHTWVLGRKFINSNTSKTYGRATLLRGQYIRLRAVGISRAMALAFSGLPFRSDLLSSSHSFFCFLII